MKHIKHFPTHNEYESFMNSSLATIPNLCFCKNIPDVHFNYDKEREHIYGLKVIPQGYDIEGDPVDVNNMKWELYLNVQKIFTSETNNFDTYYVTLEVNKEYEIVASGNDLPDSDAEYYTAPSYKIYIKPTSFKWNDENHRDDEYKFLIRTIDTDYELCDSDINIMCDRTN